MYNQAKGSKPAVRTAVLCSCRHKMSRPKLLKGCQRNMVAAWGCHALIHSQAFKKKNFPFDRKTKAGKLWPSKDGKARRQDRKGSPGNTTESHYQGWGKWNILTVPRDNEKIPLKFSRSEKVGLRPAEANINNYCHTFSKEELSSGLAWTTENTLSL